MKKRPENLLPLIRHLSVRVTPLLARLPFSANQITAASLLFGLACAWCMGQGGRWWAVLGGVFLLVDYVLDNCDGEIARLKGQTSEFGKFFDSFVDWVVHACFFAALGIGVAAATGGTLWLWLGWIAAAGSTINYFAGFFFDAHDRARGKAESGIRVAPQDAGKPATRTEWLVFAFRELARSDFCFLVLFLAAFDATWILLPAGAIGAQVYWASQFVDRAREFHA